MLPSDHVSNSIGLGCELLIPVTLGAAGALRYAKAYFGRFSYSNTQDIQRLMGCLLFPGRLRQSPYKDMLSNDMWNEVANEFVRQCCGLLGQVWERLFSCACLFVLVGVSFSAGF